MKRLILLSLLVFGIAQGQTRSAIQTQIDAIATGVPNTALKVRTILNTLANGTAQTGDIKEIDVTNGYLASNFDVTGLGTNERLGWAICNGNNGTRNRLGRVGIQYNPTGFATLGDVGGEINHTLTINEMPSHTHENNGSANDNGDPGQFVITSPTNGGEVVSVVSSSKGGGLPHNNMQPYIVTLVIMKL